MGSCNVSLCVKVLLIILNIFVMLCGVVLTGIGLWIIVAPDVTIINNFFKATTSMEFINYSAYLLIAAGCFIVVIGMIGVVGAALESKALLIIYIVLLTLILVAEIAAGALILIFRKQIESKIHQVAADRLKFSNYTGTDGFYSLMNLIQTKFECCGVNNTKDYEKAYFHKNYTIAYPYSCCALKNGTFAKTIITRNDVHWSKCNHALDARMHKIGCQKAITDYAEEHMYLLIGLAFGICALQLFPIIFACCLVATSEK